jgi:ubiquitin-like modifier-activating enzyme ATG7
MAPALISSATDASGSDGDVEGLLGNVPHSIRGSIHSFHQFAPTTALFSHCTGCSRRVLDSFEQEKFEFLRKVCNGGANYLEELTGLSKLMADTNVEDVLEFSDDDSTSCKSSSG